MELVKISFALGTPTNEMLLSVWVVTVMHFGIIWMVFSMAGLLEFYVTDFTYTWRTSPVYTAWFTSILSPFIEKTWLEPNASPFISTSVMVCSQSLSSFVNSALAVMELVSTSFLFASPSNSMLVLARIVNVVHYGTSLIVLNTAEWELFYVTDLTLTSRFPPIYVYWLT